MSYYSSTVLNTSFEEAISSVTEELKRNGFGIMSDIDVKKALKEKLNVDFRKYRILGACNPPFAYRAMQIEDKIGLMMPCNVIVQELDEGKIEIAAIDPVASMQAIENEELNAFAEDVRTRLIKVIGMTE